MFLFQNFPDSKAVIIKAPAGSTDFINLMDFTDFIDSFFHFSHFFFEQFPSVLVILEQIETCTAGRQ